MYKLFTSSQTTWEQQLEDIKHAHSVIYFEQYIISDFNEGDIGQQFLSALIERAKSGLEVRLIIDFQGSLELFNHKSLNNELREAGVKIQYYKTLPFSKISSPIRIFLRNHRKLLLIDHEISWIGGVVIAENYKNWSDLMVRFTNSTIADYCNREFRHQLQRIGAGNVILAPFEKMTDEYQLVGNSPGLGNRYCYEQITHQILLAKETITLVTPYFSPPLKLRRVLQRQLERGLEITLVIPRNSDNKFADWAREMVLKNLVNKGLIVRYLDFMNHAKIVVTDDTWSTFGSTNIDALSLITNHELNISTTDTNLVKDISKQIATWCENTKKAETEDLLLNNLTISQKSTGFLLRYLV